MAWLSSTTSSGRRGRAFGTAGLVATGCPGPGTPSIATAATPAPAPPFASGPANARPNGSAWPPPASCNDGWASSQGASPLAGARWAEKVLPSKVDWRLALAAEVRWGVQRAAGMVDYSYRKPSRRAEAAPGIIFPVLQQPVPDVAVVCDTSGSMTEGQLGLPGRGRGTAAAGRATGQAGQGPGLRRGREVGAPGEPRLSGRTGRRRRHRHGDGDRPRFGVTAPPFGRGRADRWLDPVAGRPRQGRPRDRRPYRAYRRHRPPTPGPRTSAPTIVGTHRPSRSPRLTSLGASPSPCQKRAAPL